MSFYPCKVKLRRLRHRKCLPNLHANASPKKKRVEENVVEEKQKEREKENLRKKQKEREKENLRKKQEEREREKEEQKRDKNKCKINVY